MHRVAAAVAAVLILAGAAGARADEGPPAPPPQEDDAEEPVAVPAAPLPERQLPMAPPPPEASVRSPFSGLSGALGAPAPLPPLPPPMPPSYYQQQAPGAQRTLAGRTHDLLLPTGEMLRDGEVELHAHDFLYYTGAVALNDRVEINFSAPILPFFAQVGLRFGVTPRDSRFKLVVGSNAYFSLLSDSAGDTLLSGTATAAYQTDRFNVHATGMFFYATSANEDGGHDATGLTSFGASLLLSGKVALFGDFTRVVYGDRERSHSFYAPTAGIKLLGDQVDVDLGFVFFGVDDDKSDTSSSDPLFPLPMVSAHKRF